MLIAVCMFKYDASFAKATAIWLKLETHQSIMIIDRTVVLFCVTLMGSDSNARKCFLYLPSIFTTSANIIALDSTKYLWWSKIQRRLQD